jgi:hypothetical protein
MGTSSCGTNSGRGTDTSTTGSTTPVHEERELGVTKAVVLIFTEHRSLYNIRGVQGEWEPNLKC